MTGLRDEAVEGFRCTTLVEAAESWQGLWQPWAASSYYFRDLDDEQRMELVVCTLRSLYREGFIRFFRFPTRRDQIAAEVSDVPGPAEIDRLLAPGDQLRVDPSYPDDDDAVAVWFEATESGIARVGVIDERDVLPAT